MMWRPRQERIGLQQDLPQLPHLVRRQVEATLWADGLSRESASTVRAGVRIGKAHAVTLS